MALHYKKRAADLAERCLELHFDQAAGPEKIELRRPFLPAEWFPQSGAQLTWPHEQTDWRDMLNEVTACYLRISFEIASREPLLIVTPEPDRVEALLKEQLPADACRRISFARCSTNDTWARDHAFITLIGDAKPTLLDFCFNSWGMKYAANLDNQINRKLMQANVLNGTYSCRLDFVLEGGSVESDGCGTVLTTASCLLAPNRNDTLSKADIEQYLKSALQAERILWLEAGHLEGDDTDGHIDMLARFCPQNTIAYVQCKDKTDNHYADLAAMEKQLRTFKTLSGEAYRLIPLPLPSPIYDENRQRLPASYANFFAINGAVLMPFYNQPANDNAARAALQKAFPMHEIVGIDCRPLIRQHGSLHCCTMQFPAGVLKPKI